ncbi:MAG: PadR family transcriptional regulator [Desulfobacteraceae bacterium]|nr:PadR family transcriptional regulator [Desulfobacteraceae bacterium]
MHGYDIMLYLKDHLRTIWYVGTSQLYALLKKMEEQQLVETKTKTQLQRPSKRIHQLTPSGEAEFISWVCRPCDHVRDLRIEFMAKLFFIHRHNLAGGRQLIAGQRLILNHRLTKMKQRSRDSADAYQDLLRNYKMKTLNNWLDWIDRCAEPFINEHVAETSDV